MNLRYRYPREYSIWTSMKARCRDKNNMRYGGRGIQVCARWQDSFASFIEDIGRCPDGYSIHRKDNAGDYTPDNCEWASSATQMNNRESNLLMTFKGITQTMAQWARELGIDYGVLKARKHIGWTDERALSEPVVARETPFVSYQGVTKTIMEWAADLGFNPDTLRDRKERGWSDEAIIATPIQENEEMFLTRKGETLSLTEWARRTGISYGTLIQRKKKLGWTDERCLTTPVRQEMTLTKDGVTHTVAEWENITGVGRKTLQRRKSLGWTDEQCLTTPVQARG